MLFVILIEIVITIERISNFKLRFRSITRQKPKNVGAIFLLASLIINVQYFFNQEPAFIDLKLDATKMFRINYIQSTGYILSLTGIIINFCKYFLRDAILLVIQCFLTILLIHFLKNYFKNKRNIVQPDSKLNTNLTNYQNNTVQTASNIITLPIYNKSPSVNKKINSADQNLTIMIVIMTFLSILEHFLLIFLAVSFTYFRNEITFLIVVAGDFSFKHFLNFFLLYLFNKIFKTEFKKSLI